MWKRDEGFCRGKGMLPHYVVRVIQMVQTHPMLLELSCGGLKKNLFPIPATSAVSFKLCQEFTS